MISKTCQNWVMHIGIFYGKNNQFFGWIFILRMKNYLFSRFQKCSFHDFVRDYANACKNKSWLCVDRKILPLFRIKSRVISNGSSMPSFWDMVNFYKIHPLLFAKEKILGFNNFFVKCYFVPPTARSKKVFLAANWLKNCCEMDPKMLPVLFRAQKAILQKYSENAAFST